MIKVDLRGPGGLVLPLAHVAPTNAAGTVQFKDGNRNLDGPRQVIGGFAIGQLMFLGGGEHSITAVFTPANPAEFKPSTSKADKFRF
ncbi:MAG: Ig-like domain-containing protein [Pseudonocardiaceae bacterium]